MENLRRNADRRRELKREVGDAETQDKDRLDQVLRKTELLSRTAWEIGCGVVQVNAFCELQHLSETETIKLTARNIRKICKLGAEHGVTFQYEGAAWTPIHSLRQCTDLISQVAMDNFRLVLDYWHLWASREWTQAVRATGYNGSFSAEILGDTLRESNLRGIAVEALRRMKVLVAEHS